MKNSLLKDTFREIINTFSRFISIFAIIAIGVGFFAGVKASGPDMRLTANKYYQDYHLMDIRLLSTMGFNDKDVDAIRKTSGVSQVSPSNFLDVFVEKNNRKSEVRVLSLSDPIAINIPRVITGRLPKKPGECAVEVNFLIAGTYKIGDTVQLLPDKDKKVSDTLATDQYTIVGTVNSPQYISYDRGNSTIGNGTIDYYIMVPQKDFKVDYYTEVFIISQFAQKAPSYSKEYDQILSDLKETLKGTASLREDGRYVEILNTANKELAKGKKEYVIGKEKLAAGIQKANNEFKNAQRNIEDGSSALQNEKNNFWEKINTAQNKIDSGRKEYLAGESAYHSGYSQLIQGKIQLDVTKKYLDANKEILPQEEYLKALNEYNLGKEQLQRTEEQLNETKVQLESIKTFLDSGQKELNIQKTIGLVQLEKAQEKLDQGQRDLNKAKSEYKTKIKESQEKLDTAQLEIADAQKKISKIKKPIWYVNTRNDNPGYKEYGQNSDRIDAIAKVFPVFFLLVAALVSLTTMTRMVEEQRTHIGTLKALGYSKFSIVSKYFIYANLASATGSIVGLLIGFQLFPLVIFTAYGIMYDLPPLIAPFHVDFALFSVAAAVACTSLSVLFACSKELHAHPAALMRPKSPKAGKRVLLERVPFIWNQMSFTTKVTARNLFRYKKRMFMTVIGIAGCTALMLTGFGVKDSISHISQIQFGEISTYDITAILDEDQVSQNAKDILSENSNVEKFLPVRLKSVEAGNSKENYTANIFVPQDPSKLDGFVHLRTYEEKNQLKLNDDGVIITLKLARLLKKEIGDNLIIEDSSGKESAVVIRGINENYMSHYIYMTPAYFKQIFGEESKYNALLGDMKDTSSQSEDEISEKLLELDNVVGLNFTQNHIRTFADMIGSLNYVVLVLIISASLLAFVVLYNLTNINVNERLREIATIKVLGFYDNEVSAYIYRENMVLTLMGTFAGFGLGAVLHQFVIQTAEVNDLMFGRIISTLSYVISGLLTVVFALCVNIVLHFRLKKIDMVESLKSVE